jgi:hypothetical protein
MAFAIGASVHFTSGGVVYAGTVAATPNTLATGLPNSGGGEPFYLINATVGDRTQVLVRATEVTS